MVHDPGLYARSFADVYDDWYGDIDDPKHLVDAVSKRCGPGANVLELGSGTGRLATPLCNAGFRVLALDASDQMLRRSASGSLPVAADMAMLPLRAASVECVIVAYNTFFNLASIEQQQRCLADCARVLRTGGVVALEAFIAAESADGFGLSMRDHPTEATTRLAIVTGRHESTDEVIVGTHIEVGTTIMCRPWRLCYQSPDQLDALAARAGLHLVERTGDWQGDHFDAQGLRHVSWYKRR